MSRCFTLTTIEQRTCDAFARVVRMNKERTNLRRLRRGIEIRRISRNVLVAAEKRTAPAPTAATDETFRVLDDEVGAILNQRSVDAKHRCNCRFNFRSEEHT